MLDVKFNEFTTNYLAFFAEYEYKNEEKWKIIEFRGDTRCRESICRAFDTHTNDTHGTSTNQPTYDTLAARAYRYNIAALASRNR